MTMCLTAVVFAWISLYQCYDADMDAAFGAMLGTAKHTWLGEFRGERQITERFPLTWAYFTRYVGEIDSLAWEWGGLGGSGWLK